MKKPIGFKGIEAASMITQLGLSIVLPIVLMTIGAVHIKNKFSLGSWVVILGIVLGVGSGFSSMYNFYKMVMKNNKKED